MESGMQELEKVIFEYLDKFKVLVSPQTWENVLMDCSKNEVFVMLLLYRKGQVNMTQIADYIQVPLNTATGIVARMEKKRLVMRQRSEEDKRVVTISMRGEGMTFIKNILGEFLKYAQIVMKKLTPEELQTGVQILEKIMQAMDEEYEKVQAPETEKRVRKITIE